MSSQLPSQADPVALAEFFAAVIPTPDLAEAWGLHGVHFAMFAGVNASALVTLFVSGLSDEQIDDQIRHAQRTGALVLLVCSDTEQLEEVATSVSVMLPQHRRVSCEQAMLGCLGLPN